MSSRPGCAQENHQYEPLASGDSSFSAAAIYSPTCHSQKTCCTHPLRRRRGGTRRSVSSRVLTLTLWMSNVQDATRSRRCSAMLRQWCCVWAVQQSCVSQLEAKHVSQRGAHSGGSSTNCSP